MRTTIVLTKRTYMDGVVQHDESLSKFSLTQRFSERACIDDHRVCRNQCTAGGFCV